jgi:hypothetical protein
MKRYIVLFFCITYCATAMGQQHWFVALLQYCLPTHHSQQSGIQIEVRLYTNEEPNPISSDSRFYYKDKDDYYVPVYDPVELSAFHADNRITLDMPTIEPINNAIPITFNARIGGHNRVDEKTVTVNIGSPKKETFKETNLYAIISASKATRKLR